MIRTRRFFDRVGLASKTQSILGMSVPSVKIPQFTKTGYFPALNSSNRSDLSSFEVKLVMNRASTPKLRNLFVIATTWLMSTQKTKVDFRFPLYSV